MNNDIKTSLIVAMSTNRTIGKDNQLPWHLPADLAHFKKVTMGKPVIMGRKTWESIGRPLPGRENIVVTRRELPSRAGIHVVADLDEAMAVAHVKAKANHAGEIMIIGGAQIFEQTVEYSDRIYLTTVVADIEGDTFFPPLNEERWVVVHRDYIAADERSSYPCIFEVLEKRSDATG